MDTFGMLAVLAVIALVGIVAVVVPALRTRRNAQANIVRNVNGAPMAAINPHQRLMVNVSEFGTEYEYSRVVTPAPSDMQLLAETHQTRAIAAAMGGPLAAFYLNLPQPQSAGTGAAAPTTSTTVHAASGAAPAASAIPAPAVTLKLTAGSGAKKREVTAGATLTAGCLGGEYVFTFDGTASAPQPGNTATHKFTAPGTVTVQVDYKQPDGQVATATDTIIIS